MSDEKRKDSQQEPPHNSGLQTPQPDQRLPTEAERSNDQSEETVEVTKTTETTEVRKEPAESSDD